MTHVLALVLGYLIDVAVGDPRWLPHPVVGMGKTITWAERVLRGMFPDTAAGQRSAGLVLAVALPLATLALSTAALALASGVGWWLVLALDTLMCYQCLATHELVRQTSLVQNALELHDLDRARQAVSMVVGRQTDRLDEAGVSRAAVETVAENASDGGGAPLVYLALGGGPLGLAYKAVNTMDSMIGYKNERYLDFGRCAARLDDVVNFIPARLCALAMVAISPLLGLSAREAWRVWRQDRGLSESPNAGQTESAAAGALGVCLGGPATYFGKVVEKPWLNETGAQAGPGDIARANRLMVGASILVLTLCCAIRLCLSLGGPGVTV